MGYVINGTDFLGQIYIKEREFWYLIWDKGVSLGISDVLFRNWIFSKKTI